MIGTALCERLLESGFDVIGVDIEQNRWSKVIDEKTIRVDLRDEKQLQKIPSYADAFVHLAANARVYDLVVRPELAFDNTLMTHRCLEFCRKNKIPRFVFASSREVYGNQGKTVYHEEESNVEFLESPYAASKFGCEGLVWSYHHCYDPLDAVIVRFSNVYGRYDQSNRLIPTVMEAIRGQKTIRIFGQNKALDFTYLDDAVSGLMLVLQKFEAAKNNTFNIAFGKEESIEAVVRKMLLLRNAKNKVEIGQSRPGEVIRFCADISKARKILGFSPNVGISEGLQKTIDWYQKH